MSLRELLNKKCESCEGGTAPLGENDIQEYLKSVPGWEFQSGEITRTFDFKNYYETVSFVNAVTWIAHSENHHPEIEFSYRRCKIRYSTHAIKGISENDFICAAKINRLAQGS